MNRSEEVKDFLLSKLSKLEFEHLMGQKKLHKRLVSLDPSKDVIKNDYRIMYREGEGYVLVKMTYINDELFMNVDISDPFYYETDARNFCIEVAQAVRKGVIVETTKRLKSPS